MTVPDAPKLHRRILAKARTWLAQRTAEARWFEARDVWPKAGKAWNWTVVMLARHYVAILIVTALVVCFTALLIGLWRVPFLVNGLLDDLQANSGDPDATRGVVVALAAVLATITILGTLITQSIRVWTSERQTRTIEQGHVTDRLTKAIEQLGAEKTVKRIEKDAEGADIRDADGRLRVVETTVPNLEVRLGAIYALERIALDSERDHQTIMEILCAYIRQNAKAGEAISNPLDDQKELDSIKIKDDYRKILKNRNLKFRDWLAKQSKPRVDIQAAATVIGRRPDPRRWAERRNNFRLDLRDTNLRRVDLHRAQLDRAFLRGARLEGANINGANLQETDLIDTALEGATLRSAWLQATQLVNARMEGTDLRGALLDRTHLVNARLEGALFLNARFDKSNLKWAKLRGADLREAEIFGPDFRGADFRNADWSDVLTRELLVQSADLRNVQGLTQAQLENAVGNEGTLLPDWPNESGEPFYVWSCWEAPPPAFEAILAAAVGESGEGERFRKEFLCSPENPRRKTGTPLALDAPYPKGHPLARDEISPVRR